MYILYIYMCVYGLYCSNALSLLVIPIINGFTATSALRYNRVWVFLYIYT